MYSGSTQDHNARIHNIGKTLNDWTNSCKYFYFRILTFLIDSCGGVVSQQLSLPGWGQYLLQSLHLHGVLVGRRGDGEEAGGEADQPAVGGRHVGQLRARQERGDDAHTAAAAAAGLALLLHLLLAGRLHYNSQLSGHLTPSLLTSHLCRSSPPPPSRCSTRRPQRWDSPLR